MSFGFGVGDFIAVGNLCWKVYKKCKDSSGSYVELSGEVSALYAVIKETEELLSQQQMGPKQQAHAATCQQGCEGVLRDLEALLAKYESLGTKSQRTFNRMGMGMQDVNGIRMRLTSNVSMLDAFNNVSSHARLEKKLNMLIAEVRAGKREGSVISVQTFDTATRLNQETWDELRRDLEDIGISRTVITEKRHFIINWFQEAVKAGKLDEDEPTLGANNSIAPGSTSDLVDTVSLSMNSLGADQYPERANRTTGNNVASALEPSISAGMSTFGRPKLQSSEPEDVKRGPRTEKGPGLLTSAGMTTSGRSRVASSEPADVKSGSKTGMALQSQSNKGKSRLSVSYLIDKLRNPESTLLNAIENQNIQKVRDLLHKGADSNAVTYSRNGRMTVLELAAFGGNIQIVQLLLDHGAKVDAGSNDIESALFFALWESHYSIAQLLVRKGANVLPRDSRRRTALHWVLEIFEFKDYRSVEMVGGEYINDLPTDRPVSKVGFETARLLLEHGAAVNYRDEVDITPLVIAARGGQTRVVQLLIEYGADIHYTIPPSYVDSREGPGLIEYGNTNYNIPRKPPSSALALAAEGFHPETLRLLIKNGATGRSEVMSQLIESTSADAVNIIRILLDSRADPNFRYADGYTVLHKMAANVAGEAIVRLLLEKGARMEDKGPEGSTPLILAVKSGNQVVLQVLLDKGADIGVKDGGGATLLEFVARTMWQEGLELNMQPLEIGAQRAILQMLLISIRQCQAGRRGYTYALTSREETHVDHWIQTFDRYDDQRGQSVLRQLLDDVKYENPILVL